MKHCECWRDKVRERFYAGIPLEFRGLRLDTLAPDLTRHQAQGKVLQQLRADPFASYLFFGANGVGKTMFSYLLLMHAFENGRKTVAISLDRLLKQFRRHEFNSDEWPVVTAEGLEPPPVAIVPMRKDWSRGEPVEIPFRRTTLLLDEISATSPTEYAAKEFFHLLKAAHEHGHQVLATCNVTPPQLQQHWSRQDPFWANSISRRIADYMKRVDLTKG